MTIKWYNWIEILFIKKRLMKNKKSQYLFNQMFKPVNKRKVKKDLKNGKFLNKGN